ncbi:hypothetical protein BDF21DRAFT_417849 [Thamnidium elegans]|nr:hypothetical protein BDF21DRAFT_417849 [Thamnidium elegans]
MQKSIILAILSTLYLGSVVALPNSCPTEDGLSPVANDCNKFIRCSFGVSYEFDCPQGLQFDPKAKLCNRPSSKGSCTFD